MISASEDKLNIQHKTLSFHTPSGEIIGWQDKNVIRATGIRYAEAKRFGVPTPIKASQFPIEAHKMAGVCPQEIVDFVEEILGSHDKSKLEANEHCQHLSIMMPSDISPTEKLPVMVWIHGGAYMTGAADAPIFDTRLLVEEQRVIVVSVAYRLGLFGYLGGYANRPANLGLLDLIEALRWIKQNISAFGGNTDCITLFGESAGGDAIAHLMIAEGTKDLFQRVIMQSAPLGLMYGREKMTAMMQAIAADIPETATVAEILSKQSRIAILATKFGLKGGMPFGSQYGHAPLPKETELAKAWLQCAPNYEVLIGFNDEETSFFLPTVKPVHPIIKLPLIGKPLKKWIIKTTTDKVYRKASIKFAKRHTKGGGKAYVYNISWGSKTNGLGATHTIDIPLLFGDEQLWNNVHLLKGIPWEETYKYGKQMRSLWATFASTGHLPDKGNIHPNVLHYKRIYDK